MLAAPTVDSTIHCDRSYIFAADNTGDTQPWSAFFDAKTGKYLYLLQDSHDPTDNAWSHNMFAEIRWPIGATAVVSCFVPISDANGNLGNANPNAVADGGPNAVDPAGLWTDTGETFQEGNGIVRRRYTKTLSEREGGSNTYTLYHATGEGWGYVYIVELIYGLPPAAITITDLHTSEDCGPVFVPVPTVESLLYCDRDSYIFAQDQDPLLSYDRFFAEHPTISLIQDSHDPNDRSFAHNRFVEVNIPSGATATFYALVPIADRDNAVSGSHAHTVDDYPNMIDPLGGWVELGSCTPDDPATGGCFRESNGILRKMFTKEVSESFYILYHTTHLGWGYVYLVDATDLPTEGTLIGAGTAATNLFIDDLHSGVGDGCGPVMLAGISATSQPNCDRDYQFGSDFGIGAGFFESHRDEELYAIQDAHDPDDFQWAHNMFAEIHVPPATDAHLYCFVPTGENDGHAHSAELWPNALDPQGGWRDTGITYGTNRQLFIKTVRGGADGASYVLYHSTTQGWGYFYVVGLVAAPVIDLGMIDMHVGTGDECGPILVANPGPRTPGNCDRSYQLEADFGIGDTFFSGIRGNLWLLQDAHDPNDHDWAHNQFAILEIPSGATANIYCFVPMGDADGHSHTEDDLPNSIDPLGGWLDSSTDYSSSGGGGRRRLQADTYHLWTKSVSGGDQGGVYILYHTVHLSWGYVYMVELVWSIDTVTVTDLHMEDRSGYNGCGPVLTPAPNANTLVNCDRGYTFNSDEFRVGDEFFRSKSPSFWVIADAHDPTDNQWAHNQFAAVTVPAGRTAILYVFVPASTAANAMPNQLDPVAGWERTEESYTGSEQRTIWSKTIAPRQVRGRDVPSSYTLYHATGQGHGFVYCIELV